MIMTSVGSIKGEVVVRCQTSLVNPSRACAVARRSTQRFRLECGTLVVVQSHPVRELRIESSICRPALFSPLHRKLNKKLIDLESLGGYFGPIPGESTEGFVNMMKGFVFFAVAALFLSEWAQADDEHRLPLIKIAWELELANGETQGLEAVMGVGESVDFFGEIAGRARSLSLRLADYSAGSDGQMMANIELVVTEQSRSGMVELGFPGITTAIDQQARISKPAEPLDSTDIRGLSLTASVVTESERIDILKRSSIGGSQ